MKKKSTYLTPKLDLIIAQEDVLTTSGEPKETYGVGVCWDNGWGTSGWN